MIPYILETGLPIGTSESSESDSELSDSAVLSGGNPLPELTGLGGPLLSSGGWETSNNEEAVATAEIDGPGSGSTI
jgi:hypothetical protein